MKKPEIEIGTDADSFAVTAEIEEKFKEIIDAYCDILTSPDYKKHEEFGRGALWGFYTLLDTMGVGAWANTFIDVTIEEYKKGVKDKGGFFGFLESRGMEARLRRIIIPGNRFTSAINR